MTPETTKKVLDARACTLREAQVGTENSKFVTPQVLASMRATNAQAIAGTLTNVFITPSGLKAAIDAAVKKAISEAKEEGV